MAHGRYLPLFLIDDVLREPAEAIVMTVFDFCPRHVDCGLPLRDHDGYEVAIHVTCRFDEHLATHVADGQIISEQELLLLGFVSLSLRMQHLFWILSEGERTCRDRQCGRQRDDL